MNHPIIIIGAGLSSYQLAREFRKLDQTTPLQIITADDGHFYSKPQLSNAFATKRSAETLVNANAATMAKQLNATITTQSKVTRIDPTEKKIFCGEHIYPYSKLVLACGAEVIKPPLVGSGVEAILSVNHIHDYAHFRESILEKRHIVIFGAGLIGCEFANDLIDAGFEVHVIAPANAPIDLLIPEQIGHLLQKALEQKGVHFHFGCLAHRVEKNKAQLSIELSNGETLTADCILSAIGLTPSLTLAKTAHIHTNRGIVVNHFLETNYADIYALGDCAEVEGQVLPFIIPLLMCGRALAHTLAGTRTAVHYPAAMPITVKTPAYPIVICLPPKNINGEWQTEIKENNARALFYDAEKNLRGFILTKEYVTERAHHLQQIPVEQHP